MTDQVQALSEDAAKRIMGSRILIPHPGKYHVRVQNDPHKLAETFEPRSLPGGGHICSIANFAAVTPYMAKRYKALMREGRFNEAANQSLSTSIRTRDYMPQQNETLVIMVDFVPVKDSSEVALMVTSFTPMPLSHGTKIDVDKLLSEDEEESLEMILVPEETHLQTN